MGEWMKKNREMTMTIICAIFLIIAFIFEMNEDNFISPFLYIIGAIIGGWESGKNVYKDLFHKHKVNVDLLMVLAAIGSAFIGEFREGAMLIFIFSLAESLEDMAIARTSGSITKLMNLTPDVARRYTDNGEIEEVPTKELKIGDRLQIRKGESVPIDGELLSDFATMDEAAITGEPLPVTKQNGEEIVGGTINTDNAFDMKVTVENEDTLFSKVIRMVDEAQNTPSRTNSYIKKIENTYVKMVLVIVPLFILLMPFLLGYENPFLALHGTMDVEFRTRDRTRNGSGRSKACFTYPYFTFRDTFRA